MWHPSSPQTTHGCVTRADFWTDFLRTLRDRGLRGTQLVISDHHRGLMNAIDTPWSAPHGGDAEFTLFATF